MKCVIIKKPHEVVLTEREMPALREGFARIKVGAAAICATDLEVIDGNIPADYPNTPGHEWAGRVVEVNDPAFSHMLGKRVTGSNDVTCGKCEHCRSGNWRYCKEFKEIGFRGNGAYAEYLDVPAAGLVELPDSLPYEHAALAEPMGVALGVWEKLNPQFGKTCLIYGAGSIGLCCLAVARALGLRKIVVVATSRARLAIAEKLGAYATVATREEDLFEKMKEYHPDGTDYIIEATGIEECIQNSLKLCTRGGYVALAGYGRGKTMSIRMDDIHIANLHVVGAGNNWNQHGKAVNFMADGGVDMSLFATDIIKLEEFERGLELARTRPVGFVKAIFRFEE